MPLYGPGSGGTEALRTSHTWDAVRERYRISRNAGYVQVFNTEGVMDARDAIDDPAAFILGSYTISILPLGDDHIQVVAANIMSVSSALNGLFGPHGLFKTSLLPSMNADVPFGDQLQVFYWSEPWP